MNRRGWLILLSAVVVPGALFWGAFGSNLRQNDPQPDPRYPIPDGFYRAASGDDLVAIRGRKILFVVQGRDSAPTGVFMKEYDYNVVPDGRLVAYPMTSAEFMGGPITGRYKWTWDGTAITRHELKIKGEPMSAEPTMVFTRQDDSSLPQSDPRYPIPDGFYRAACGDELVAIRGSKILFVVQGRDSEPAGVVMKVYDYNVVPDGRLVAYPMTSAEALYGPVGRYDWTWDGEVITRHELEIKGEPMSAEPAMVFTRQDDSSRRP